MVLTTWDDVRLLICVHGVSSIECTVHVAVIEKVMCCGVFQSFIG